MNQKRCPRCEEVLAVESFAIDRRAKDGRQSACRSCTKAWRAANREYLRARNREYFASRRQERRERSAAWRRANPERVVQNNWEANYRIRALRYGLVPVIEPFTPDELVERWGDACYLCGGEADQIDHVKEVRQGGHHTLENVRPCCGSCNSRKAHEVRRAMAKSSN